eukprot:210440_1
MADYVISKSYAAVNTCCNADAQMTVLSQATDVCFKSDASSGMYTMASCTAAMDGTSNRYMTKYCNETAVATVGYSYDSCDWLLDYMSIPIYNRLQVCIKGGQVAQMIDPTVCDDHITTTEYITTKVTAEESSAVRVSLMGLFMVGFTMFF